MSFWVDPTDVTQSLGYIVRHFLNGHLRKPNFQREFIWPLDKKKNWVQRILFGHNKKAFGAICTYQLRQDVMMVNDIFLCDGFQRLSTIKELIETPDLYNVTLSFNEIMDRLDSYQIGLQHRIFDTHDEGFNEFQNLNIGTAAHPGEYYKGELVKMELGEYIYAKCIHALNVLGSRISRMPTGVSKRDKKLQYERDSLALFYRYVTKSKIVSNWNVSSNRVSANPDKPPIEKLMYHLIQNRTKVELDKDFTSFEKFLTEQTALIEDLVFKASGNIGQGLTIGLYRAFLHLSIYRRNVNWSVANHIELMNLILSHTENNKYSGRIVVEEETGTIRSISFSLHDPISKGLAIAKMTGIALPQHRRQQPQNFKLGFDNSHNEAFSIYGEGDTFPEPAPLNRARGARDVNPKNA